MKRRITDLCCFGGKPLFDEMLHVGRPNLCARNKIHAALDDIFDRRWLTNDGLWLRRFEEALKIYLGVKNCIAVCNATIGLQMAYRVLGRPQRSASARALMPAYTFIATAHAWAWEGGQIRFCDADRSTHLLELDGVRLQAEDGAEMLIGVHTWGRPCHVDALEGLSREKGIPLVFDAAHAFSNRHGNRRIGGFGDAEVFSFHATKFLNTFEGGAITTNNDALAGELRSMRNFGFAGYDQVTSLGTNGKMPEISAAMGLFMLEEIESILDINRRNYFAYQRAMSGIPGCEIFEIEKPEQSNCQYIVYTLSSDYPVFARDLLMKVLLSENVRARRYFYPGVHRSEPYFSRSPEVRLPGVDYLCERVIVLPTGTAVDEVQISQLAEVIHFILQNLDAIRSRFEKA